MRKLVESDNGDMLHQLDLENWKYFLKHPDETLNEGQTIFIENMTLKDSELELMRLIKKNTPISITELAKFVNKETIIIQKKINHLEKEG